MRNRKYVGWICVASLVGLLLFAAPWNVTPSGNDQAQAGPIRNLIWNFIHRNDPQPEPEPTPEPTPPNPEPTPEPLPIPVPPNPAPVGLRVLLTGPSPRSVEGLSPDQRAILSSRIFRDWTDKSCEKGPDGAPMFRILAKGAAVSADWKALLDKAPADKCSMIAVVPGKDALVVDFPANVQAALEQLSAYAGVQVKLPPKAAVPNPPVFTDEQWKQFTDPKKVVIFNGQKRFLSVPPRDLKKMPYGSAPGTVSIKDAGVTVIPRSQWPACIAALKSANGGLMALAYGKVACSDQDGLGYCWVHSVKNSAEILSYEQGFPFYQLSAVSVGGPITGYRNEGGWPADALDYMVKNGAVGTKYWPENKLSSSYFKKAEVQADYPRHKVAGTIVDLGTTGKIFDECVSCVLMGAPVAVSYNWWGHAIQMVGVEYKNGVYYGVFRNSWGSSYGDDGFFLMPEGRGSNKGTPDDAQALMMMVSPDFVARKAKVGSDGASLKPLHQIKVPVEVEVKDDSSCPDGRCNTMREFIRRGRR